jgi:hypothetical protein
MGLVDFKDSLLNWVVLIGMAVGVAFRGFEWYYRSKKLTDDASSYATNDDLTALEQRLTYAMHTRALEWDRDIKNWARDQTTSRSEYSDLRRRVDRLEDRQ